MATTAYTYIHYNDLNGLRIMSMNDCMWAQRELELLLCCFPNNWNIFIVY